MTAHDNPIHDTGGIPSSHSSGTGAGQGAVAASAAAAASRGRPFATSVVRAPAEGPTVDHTGCPGRHVDPSSGSGLFVPSSTVIAARQDSFLRTSRTGASLSSTSANTFQAVETSSPSMPLLPVTSGAPTQTTVATRSNNLSSNSSSGGDHAAVVKAASSGTFISSFVPPANGATAARDPAGILSSSSTSAAAAVGLPAGHMRSNFSNGAVPPPLQTSSSAAPAADAGPSFPPVPPPPPPYLSTTMAATTKEEGNTSNGNGGASSGSATATERKRETEAAGSHGRPAVALSAHLLELYKTVNAQYCAQRRLESPGPKYNNGYDDKDGHYLFLPGEVIFQRYIAQDVLGKGSFGTVIRGFDQKRSEVVAMKITRRGSSFRSQAKLELDILLRLNENPALNHLVVRLLKVFEWQGHLVLVFELLSFNLYQLIKCTRFNGVSLDLVRKFAYQLTHTLLQLESQKPHPIIHCDLKPENILLRNQNRSGIRLIDFGSACYTAKRFHRYIQSRFYRSPEVILFLEYGTAIDRWSLACVLVELHTGVPIFDGRTEAAQLAKFECTLGPVPAEMIAASPKASRFYYGNLATGFQLKEPVPERRSLESVIGVTTGGPRGRRLDTPGHDEKSYREFYDFISRFLRYQPEERMSCRDALQHPFLMPLYTSDLMQQQERETQGRQQVASQQQSYPQPQPAAITPHTGAASSASHAVEGKGDPLALPLTVEEGYSGAGDGVTNSHP
ncbi:putative serine/threonine-protein kinase putative protein kinase [Leptomonas seymouri]|uniref:Protein kinase domain-containing protein n=1 Tax=Leptomonas seymouri TaxID=5684 RepID=A0A0N1PBM1_LEPSE|nr:putative serine/threonine-protein kinase putative protein kinase [Leptomonas seymouri]|eukprot:KPI85848.1 putative serine/threonine-protein kinase putative protein kinase [Leptomonas seymouri]